MRVEEKSFFVGETSNNEKSANKEKVSIFAGELNKVVRGPITEWAERIFEKK